MFFKNSQTVLRQCSIPYHINKTGKICTVYIHSSLTYIFGYVLIKFYPAAWSITFIKARTVAINKIDCGKW